MPDPPYQRRDYVTCRNVTYAIHVGPCCISNRWLQWKQWTSRWNLFLSVWTRGYDYFRYTRRPSWIFDVINTSLWLRVVGRLSMHVRNRLRGYMSKDLGWVSLSSSEGTSCLRSLRTSHFSVHKTKDNQSITVRLGEDMRFPHELFFNASYRHKVQKWVTNFTQSWQFIFAGSLLESDGWLCLRSHSNGSRMVSHGATLRKRPTR
jgi:hypothetical protein